MQEPLKDVTPIFTPTKTGAASIVIEWDKKSESFEHKSLGIWLQKIKANNMQLVVEKVDSFSDGKETYEIKVLGT